MKYKLSAQTRLAIALIPLTFALLVVLATDAGRRSLADSKKLTEPVSKTDAAANYSKYCARCHGSDGQAKTAKGKQTHATDLTKSRIGNAAGIKVIAKGKELMPGFNDNLSGEEIQSLMNYIRGFRK
ncbi:MAG: cytochrome c [Pyrinomonadaceae bacterium]